MHERVAQFRRRVEQHFGGRPGRGSRYPEALRAEAIAITDWSVTRGTRVTDEVAGRLGVGVATLRRWLASPPDELSELRPVEVIDSRVELADPVQREGQLALITAGGHRVEGLELAEVALLLEALG